MKDAAPNVGFFANLYKSVNDVLDRRVDGAVPSAGNKKFPGASIDDSSLNFAYNLKTPAGQKFKFSSAAKATSGGSKVTGKVVAEKLFADKELGVAVDVTVAKKDTRDTFELATKYSGIDQVNLKFVAKVDKAQKLEFKADYDSDVVSATVGLSRAVDWKLFAKLQQAKAAADVESGQTDLDFSVLTGYDECKYFAGFNGSYGVAGGKKGFKNAEIAAAYKEKTFQVAGFGRFIKNETSVWNGLTTGLNAFWSLEKDLQVAAEVRIQPFGKSEGSAIDYEIGASMPYDEGTVSFRYGLDNKFGAAYSQKLSDKVKFDVGTTINFENLNESGYKLGLTFES